jgi:hypothetical protein
VLIIVLKLKQTSKATPIIAVSVLSLLVVADILPVNLRYVPFDRFVPKRHSNITPSKADKEIMADKELGYRVFNISVSPFNDAKTSMFHRSIGGYHGAKMGRYQDLIDYYLNDGNEAVLDMLNTKYLIKRDDNDLKVIKRDNANGAAWFVERVEQKSSPKEALEALGNIDLKTTAVIEEKAPQTEITGKGAISLVEYRPNYLRYNYSLEGGSAVAVFSEIYYDKGWQAYIDGKPADSFRADYLLRAMVLPEGEHNVEWRFKAPNWNLASTITLICSILIIFALVTSFIFRYYGTKKHIE